MNEETNNPTAVKTDHAHTRISKILVPTAFSDCAKKSLFYAKAMAELNGAAIELLHVISIHDEGAIYGPVYFPIFDKEFLEASNTNLNEIVEVEPDGGATLTSCTTTRAPVAEIVRHARESAADLIVIATHGHKGIKHLLLGTTTENVARHTLY
jgi:nucleotide-binding universal stress UspA family protein